MLPWCEEPQCAREKVWPGHPCTSLERVAPLPLVQEGFADLGSRGAGQVGVVGDVESCPLPEEAVRVRDPIVRTVVQLGGHDRRRDAERPSDKGMAPIHQVGDVFVREEGAC